MLSKENYTSEYISTLQKKTGAEMKIKASEAPKFSAGKALKDLVNA